MSRIWIRDVCVINEGQQTQGDLWIEAGRIKQIGVIADVANADVVIEGRGRWLLPGLIDDQVHFREPGLTHKGDIESESRAAVIGGVTSYMEMPNCIPTTTDRSALQDKFARAKGRSFANYSFYLGATNDNLEQIKRADPTEICGIKVFMGSSTGNMLVDQEPILEGIFAHAPTLVATHCEDTPTIQANEQAALARYGEQIPISMHPMIRSEEACFASSSLAVALAKRHGTRLHVLHISTARELELFSDAPVAQKRITAEACVHHLFFCDADYSRLGTWIKCNPAIKRAQDRDAILQALRDGVIDVIATDHAPHTREEKAQPYRKAPSGLPLVQHSLLSLLEHVHHHRLSIEEVVQKTSHNVATIFGLEDRGYIREGYWADLVLVDPHAQTPVTQESLAYRCGWSPFLGHTFPARVDSTLVSGHLAWHDGQLHPHAVGQPLRFHKNRRI